MSFSGGADQKNIDQIVGCGIWPVTVATVLLKPGGYKWMTRIAEKADECQTGKGWKGQCRRSEEAGSRLLLETQTIKKGTKKAAERERKRNLRFLTALRRKMHRKTKNLQHTNVSAETVWMYVRTVQMS